MRPTKNFLKFNDSQRHALDTRRNLAVRANAGSGKTSVLVERIAQLLAQSWDDKKSLDLNQIVAITFTRKAAAELEDRLRSTFREMASLTADPDERAFWAARTEEHCRGSWGLAIAGRPRSGGMGESAGGPGFEERPSRAYRRASVHHGKDRGHRQPDAKGPSRAASPVPGRFSSI